MSATEPQPVAIRSAATPCRSASFSRRAITPMSGYRWTPVAASAIASTTPGSGPYGTSLLASLMASGRPSSRARSAGLRPGT
jgi:hypothetical protein